MQPYRIDRIGADGAKTSCFYFDILPTRKSERTSSLGQIEDFVLTHRDAILALGKWPGVENAELDIGIQFPASQASTSLALGPLFLERMAVCGLTVVLSIYKTSE